MGDQEAASGSDAGGRLLWFTPPDGAENRRRALTRERVIAEALEVISASGVETLSMRALASRLGVVPGALYRHVRSKEQLYDLILDGVLAEVDCRADPSLTWAEQVTELAQRLRVVLENHPGIAGLLKARDPLSPHSLSPGRGLPRPAPRGRDARRSGRPRLPSDLRLHPRLRPQRPHHRQRAARPRHRYPT